MKKNINLIALSLTTLLVFPSLAEVKYYTTIDAKNIVLKKELSEVPTKYPFKYITKFDLSQSGSGNYYNNDTTVIIASANLTSKPTFPIFSSETDEVRIKFNTGGANFANQIRLIDSSNNKNILLWYNYNKILYIFNSNGEQINAINVGGGGSSTMEIKFNFITKNYAFSVNDIVKFSNVFDGNPVGVYSNVFDGSGGSSLTLVDGNL